MKDSFRLFVTNSVQGEKYKFNLEILTSNQVTFGTRSLLIPGTKGVKILALSY